MPNVVWRAGIIGAGNISEFHLRALSRITDARVEAVVDIDAARADALCRKWGVSRSLRDVAELFECGVNVVHVLTPPAAHATTALAALARDCHVYVEKPLATSVEDCDSLIGAAAESRRSVCVGHSFLRDPTFMRARRFIDSGAIGDVLSVHYERSTAYPAYRGGPLPELYRAGGYPFRDMGVHGLYIIESLLGPILDAKTVVSSTGSMPFLHCDEWTVALRARRGQATLCLSWNSRPLQHAVTVHGTHGVLKADMYAMYVAVRRTRRIPAHALRIVNSIAEAAQMATGSLVGLAGFIFGRVRQYHGVQNLVEEFYASLRAGRQAPVTPRQARSVVAWTEAIAASGDRAKDEALALECPRPRAPTLVTGATGLIGRALVDRLLQDGRRLRLLVRRVPSDPALIGNPDVELIVGDLGDGDAVDRAVSGVSSIFHLGAAMCGPAEEFERGTVLGTGNVVRAALRHGVRKLIHVSSLSVLHALADDAGAPITEDWPLEPNAHRRGHYSRTKLEAEQIVRDAVRDDGLRAVILRPAEVLGDGPPRLSAGVALQFGRRLAVLGRGEARVPMVYLGDVVEALLLAEKADVRDGSIFHLVDPAEITQNELLRRLQSESTVAWSVYHVPRWAVRLAGLAGDVLQFVARRPLPVTSYRLRSAGALRRFNCERAAQVLGWQPVTGVIGALARTQPLSTTVPDDSTEAVLDSWTSAQQPSSVDSAGNLTGALGR